MNGTLNGHLDDGTLLHAIDEGSADWIAEHLRACDACASRYERIRRRSARLTATLQAADVPVPPLRSAAHRPARDAKRSRSTALALAAAVATLLIATIAVPPVRAVFIDGLRRVLPEQTAGTPANPRPAPGPETTTADSSAIVSFPIAGRTFRLTIAHQQDTGFVIIVASRTDLASASMTGSAGTETMIVRSDGLRIGNTPRSRASYRLTLPEHVEIVAIGLAGRPTTHHRAPAADSVTIDISQRR